MNITSHVIEPKNQPDVTSPQTYGLVRASVVDPRCLTQLSQLASAGVRRSSTFTIEEKTLSASPTTAGENTLSIKTICHQILKPGDTLVVGSLSRLGRTLKDVLLIVDHLFTTGKILKVVSTGMDTSTPEGKAAYQVMDDLMEADWMLGHDRDYERTMHGIALAKANQAKLGKPRKYTNVQIKQAATRYGTAGAARHLGCAKTTIIKRMKDIREHEDLVEQGAIPPGTVELLA